MKKYKQFVIGLIAGAVLFSSIGVFAEGLTVLLNQFPIVINGQQAEVEAYNINGRTFLALGDVAKYFNATAALNETTKQIEVNAVNPIAKNSTAPTAPNLMVENGIIVDVATRESVPAEFLYFDTTLKEISLDEYIDHKHCKVVKYNDNIYMHNSDIFSKLDISYKSLSYIESNSFKLYKGEKEVVSNRNTPGIRISIDGDTYFNIRLIEELLGE